MSEIDDLIGKLKEYTEREDEHSLFPRVLRALLENGRRNEEEIGKLRKIVIGGGIFLALVIPALVVAAFYLLR